MSMLNRCDGCGPHRSYCIFRRFLPMTVFAKSTYLSGLRRYRAFRVSLLIHLVLLIVVVSGAGG